MKNQVQVYAHGLGLEVAGVSKSAFKDILNEYKCECINGGFFFYYKDIGPEGYHAIIEAARALNGDR